MADLKNKLYDYFAQMHFDLMSPEVRARFDDYAKNEDFQGHMKHWNDNYKGSMVPDLVAPMMTGGVDNDNALTDDEWGDLYDAYQEAFQKMDIEKDASVGPHSEYKKATKDFIAKWFGNFADNKVFVQKEATTSAERILDDLADFLNANHGFKDVFTHNPAIKDVFSDISYDDFISGLRSHKYNSDLKFRDKVLSVVYYLQSRCPQEGYQVPSRNDWPENVGYISTPYGGGVFIVEPSSVNPLINTIYGSDTSTWFKIPTAHRNDCIDRFKDHYTEIFNTLLTKSKIREDFLAQANSSIVTEPLKKAIADTDYENKDSKDYVPEKYPDEKNWVQKLEDWKDDTYENHLRRFTNPSRGTRLFFSPWSQNIIKAFDKEKIKPTDGLEGILSKKDAVLKRLASSTTAKDHFEWFVKTVETLKTAGMGKAIEGALRNGKQMRHLVSGIIAEAVEQGKEKEAKTALEILSVAKYGLSSSRTLNALNSATKDMSILSDSGLSWNKNEGIQFVTKAIDKTAGLALRGIGLATTGIRNSVSHSRTKIGHDLRKNDVLKNAYKHWNEEDLQKTTTEKRNKAVHDLAELATGHGASGHTIDAGTYSAEKTALGTMAAGTARDNLQKDIDLYEQSVANQHNANAELAGIARRQADRTAHPENNKFSELIAYWDMLESVGKTHSFTLGSMALKRKAMLKDYSKGTSKAQTIASDYLTQFRNTNLRVA